jgi:hypothetical protein
LSALGKYVERTAGLFGVSALVVVMVLTLTMTAFFVVATVWLVAAGAWSFWWLLAAVFLAWWLYAIWLSQLR